MSFRAFTLSLACAALMSSTALALPLARPPEARIMIRTAAQPDPVATHAMIAQAQERLAEIDATITALQDSTGKLEGAARQKATDAVAALRAMRDTYRKEIDGVVAQGRQMTTDQLAVARSALTAPWTQFEQALDKDVAALKLDAAQRKALVVARVKAEQSYWQGVMADLKGSVASLTAEQRAAVERRIADVKAHADEAETRLGRLAQTSRSAWSALKQGLVNSRRVFEDAYRGTNP